MPTWWWFRSRRRQTFWLNGLRCAARSSDGKIEHRLRRTVEDASAAPDVTIVNTSSAEYHARVSSSAIIKGEKWDE